MNKVRKSIVVFTVLLLAGWAAINMQALVSGPGGTSRSILCALLAAMILLRAKPAGEETGRLPGGAMALAAVAGLIFEISGLVFRIHVAQWAGLMLLAYSALRWSLPRRYGRDLAMAVFFLYGAHSFPAQVVGPLQIVMQKLSIRGAELLLHIFNQRVWADGFILRSGGAAFEVPEACSGFVTATTVLLCALGTAVIMRLGARGALLLSAAGLVQTLALNIARISLMVYLARFMPPGWSVDFVHDSLGILLLASIVLISFQARGMKTRRDGAAREAAGTAGKPISPLEVSIPESWGGLLRSRLAYWLVAAVILAVVFAVKLRPHHRAEMIGGVGSNLILSDAEQAERAFTAALALEPLSESLRAERVRARLLRGKYSEAMDDLRYVVPGGPDSHYVVLKTWALAGMGRSTEAESIIRRLPDETRDLPGIAMVDAELAARRRDTATVCSRILKAAEWDALSDRVRALYPYLASVNEWETIAKTDSRVPYRNANLGLLAVHAHLKSGNIVAAVRALNGLLENWPDDPRLLRYLFAIAAVRPGSRWEATFAEKLVARLDSMAPDELVLCAESCFRLARPDLGWLTYMKLAERDAAHPGVNLLPAQFGADWFRFRKRFLGIQGDAGDQWIDLGPDTFHYIGRAASQWRRGWEEIPLVEELGPGAGPAPVASLAMRRCLDKALAEFEKRSTARALSLEMQYRYATALEIAGLADRAHAQLTNAAALFPGQEQRVRLLRAGLYQRTGDYQGVYEMLRDRRGDPHLEISARIMLSDAERRLKFGILALATSAGAVKLLPDSRRAVFARALAVEDFLGPEEALFFLSRIGPGNRMRRTDALELEALARTGRFAEAENFGGLTDQPWKTPGSAGGQRLSLPPADMLMSWTNWGVPSEKEFEANVEQQRFCVESASSPFVAGLARRWLALYSGFRAPPVKLAGGIDGEIAAWRSIGRDPAEQAVALQQLALLLCRFGRYADARRALDSAVSLFPGSGLLWRMCIGLSEGDGRTIEKAARECPDDPEVWLAGIVSKARGAVASGAAGRDLDESLAGEIRAAIGARRFSPLTLARAGEFCLRRGCLAAAAAACREAHTRSRGLPAIHVAAMECAAATSNRHWFAEATVDAINSSVSPDPMLFKAMVEAAKGGFLPDLDYVHALKKLKERDPGNRLWQELLGRARYERGGSDMVDSIQEMRAAMRSGGTNLATYIVASEACRQMSRLADAAEILKDALRLHPGNLQALNNLAYTLASAPDTVTDAVSLTPELLRLGGRNLEVLDTVATIHIRSGNIKEAEDALDRLDAVLASRQALAAGRGAGEDAEEPEGDGARESLSSVALRARIHRAEISLLRDDPDMVFLTMSDIFSGTQTNATDEEISEMSRILGEAEARIQQRSRLGDSGQ